MSLIEKLEKIEMRLNKLQEQINIEDRITACDVLCRLTMLESAELSKELDPKVWVNFNERLEKIESHFIKGIKKPNKCPICEGSGSIQKEIEPKIFKILFCSSCKGEGLVWE